MSPRVASVCAVTAPDGPAPMMSTSACRSSRLLSIFTPAPPAPSTHGPSRDRARRSRARRRPGRCGGPCARPAGSRSALSASGAMKYAPTATAETDLEVVGMVAGERPQAVPADVLGEQSSARYAAQRSRGRALLRPARSTHRARRYRPPRATARRPGRSTEATRRRTATSSPVQHGTPALRSRHGHTSAMHTGQYAGLILEVKDLKTNSFVRRLEQLSSRRSEGHGVEALRAGHHVARPRARPSSRRSPGARSSADTTPPPRQQRRQPRLQVGDQDVDARHAVERTVVERSDGDGEM